MGEHTIKALYLVCACATVSTIAVCCGSVCACEAFFGLYASPLSISVARGARKLSGTEVPR